MTRIHAQPDAAPPVAVPVQVERGPRVVHRAGPADWVRDYSGKCGIVGCALRDAIRKGGGGVREDR